MNKLIHTMINHAHHALKNAYAPYSKFTVAACICSEDEQLFTGVNVENSSYGLTICAERSAISQMIVAGVQTIKHIVVLAGTNELCTPCGACRQCINEFSTVNTHIHLCNKDQVLKTMTMDELLPLAFKLRV